MRASGSYPVCIVRHTRRSGRVWRVLCHHPSGVCPVRHPGKAGSGGRPAGPNTPAGSKKAVPGRTALMVYRGEIRAGDRSGGQKRSPGPVSLPQDGQNRVWAMGRFPVGIR